MRQNLLILGAGQYGLQVKEIAEAMGIYEEIAFLDDVNPVAIGPLNACNSYVSDFSNAVVAIGNPDVRLSYLKLLQKIGYQIPVLKHPSAVILNSAVLEDGCIIEPLAVINANVKIGSGCLICAGAVVNHNAVVGDVCQVDCNAVVPARCIVPLGTKIPCGSVYG